MLEKRIGDPIKVVLQPMTARERLVRVLALVPRPPSPGAAAPAAAFPDKPIELTVLFGAGSAADLLARKLAELAGKDLGQPVAVVNRTGAGGALGYTHVKGQAPDGYALVWNSNSVSTAYHAGNMKFDYTAFAGVAALTSEPVSLAVKADAPWKDIRELLAHARAHPGQVRVGNSGRGSFTHLMAVALENRAGRQAHPRAVRPRAGRHHRARRQDRGERAAAGRDHDPGDGPAGAGAGGHAATSGWPACRTSPPSRRAAWTSPCRSGAGSPRRRARRRRSSPGSSAPSRGPRRAPEFREFATRMGAVVEVRGAREFDAFIARDDREIAALMEQIGLKKQ